ncbi:DegT/DnrJ/EryC1/StrS family aminotransferase [Streptomyces sp. DH24]|uniref:DegT/DnrJ/EryC1/StrS family aminotransferase n=1 Tax=Streptomyces sp. DH24 TaxID=3040123 RepID=UPI0024432895|nr:DegT/DnrJ/EryC1/StrS family aminotransferase [Streptomyces sp. DH24]MDG9715517.1 DegT/DnrJ/EryC1/StrS family aminotransferase [Streptomyces sp. DH24]
MLALNGGPKVRERPYPRWPEYDETESLALIRALEQGDWSRHGGKEVQAFEREFAELHAAPAALAVTNGSHALELALELAGVEPGEEVLVPAYTFVATSTAVQRRGAVPVPVDVDPDTFCLDPAALDAVATDRTRAVIPVHIGGHVADMDAITAWAGRRGVRVIQDAAQAHGATWRGQGLGALGSVATFSFQSSKVLTAGEGGALLLPDDDTYENAWTRHNCGRTRELRLATASSNFRISEFTAAVLRAQLARFPAQNARRATRYTELAAALSTVPGIRLQGRDPRCTTTPHYMTTFVLDQDELGGVDRDTVALALLMEGIPAFGSYPPLHRTDAFWTGPTGDVRRAELAERCPNAERVGRDGVMIPHQALLGTRRDVEDIATALTKVLTELPRTGTTPAA